MFILFQNLIHEFLGTDFFAALAKAILWPAMANQELAPSLYDGWGQVENAGFARFMENFNVRVENFVRLLLL